MNDGPEQIIEGAVDLLTLVAWVAAGLAGALVVAFIVAVALRLTARQHSWAAVVSRRGRAPLRVALAIVGAWVGVRIATAAVDPDWYPVVQHGLLIALILALTWLVASMVYVFEDLTLARQGTSSNRARRLRTQAQVLRRVGVAVIVVCGIAAVLLTFPGARAAGASLFASAGIVSLIAGLAAQSALANVFAGMQLAFTDAIRVDDIVIAEGEWGRIEEITLTYVVLHTWDDRRIILPSTYFTTTPFENWTRLAGELLGTVDFDLDWRVPVAAMRRELDRLLARTDLWDGRVGIFQVFDATGGVVRVRALVSAADAPNQIDLKYYLRENLLLWLQREAPYAMPRSRYQAVEPAPDLEDEPPTEEETPATEVTEEPHPDTGPVDSPAVSRLDPEVAAQQEAALMRERRLARRQRKREGAGDRVHARARRPRPSTEETRRMDLSEIQEGRADVSAEEQPAGEQTGPGETPGSVRADDGGEEAAARRTSILGRPVVDTPRFFTGSPDAQARRQAFSGPGEEALSEREQTAERHRAAARGDTGAGEEVPADEVRAGEELRGDDEVRGVGAATSVMPAVGAGASDADAGHDEVPGGATPEDASAEDRSRRESPGDPGSGRR
ncbi:mechanosensitive ion channel [Georgenia sp. 10Sc9-8]|uniref:Mechanosensitive ion channel n=1 Tax=Georgenia halotolerans TaxID=3028317 RepID=A0ABT5TWL2_9MICO|nr:mechanosensitive ion channel [Georgenia halotolerans]